MLENVVTRAVATTTITEYKNRSGMTIVNTTISEPPGPKTITSKLTGVMARPQLDVAHIEMQVVEAVWNDHTISKAFETGDISAIDSIVADDFVDHTDRGDMMGKDSLKSMIKWGHENMKDMKMKAVKELADDDYVMAWMNYSGTSDGSMGMPKGPFDMNSIEVSKFRDGKAVEHWSFMNMQEMMKMMGGGQAPQMKDTTKKK